MKKNKIHTAQPSQNQFQLYKTHKCNKKLENPQNMIWKTIFMVSRQEIIFLIFLIIKEQVDKK